MKLINKIKLRQLQFHLCINYLCAMKKNLVLLVTAIALFIVGCGKTKENAAAYDQQLNDEFELFSRVYTDYVLSMNKLDSTNRKNPTNMEEHRVYACNQVVYELDTTSKMKAFGNDESYLNSLRNYFKVMQKTMQDYDGPKIKLLMKDSLMTHDDSVKVEELTTETLMASDKAYIEFQNAQKKFREKYKIQEQQE
jgi:hypothetical protein